MFHTRTLFVALVVSCVSTYSFADNLVTLDSLKSDAAAFFNSSPQIIHLSATPSSGDSIVRTGGSDYYFTAADGDVLLSTLSMTSAGYLVNVNADQALFYEPGGDQYYAYDLEAIPDSLYSLVAADSADYHFTMTRRNDDGDMVPHYYKIAINVPAMIGSPNISWNTASAPGTNIIAVNMPNNETLYYHYTRSNNVPGHLVYTTPQTALTGDVTADFTNISWNYNSTPNQMAGVTSITGDFINNIVSGSLNSGGAIYNASGDINYITGNFIQNVSIGYNNQRYGGAIYNRSNISNISGHFLANSAVEYNGNAWGGAIGNFSTLGQITGDFIANFASRLNAGSNGYSVGGGAIYNGGSIQSITGDYIGNYGNYLYTATTNSTGYGGAIYNTGSIQNISGNFIRNYLEIPNQAYGGAIYNSSTIQSIAGSFINNSVSATAVSGTRQAYGGAIFNNNNINQITGDFIGNYAQAGLLANARGGAIYANNGNLTIRADAHRPVIFRDNYVTDGVDKKLNAIHIHNGGVNMEAAEGSYIDIRDPVSSTSSSGAINSTGQGAVYLWGDNSDFSGTFNINAGSFGLLFDENDTEWSQRDTANLNNAIINFYSGSVYRPGISPTALASLSSSGTSVGSDVIFLPYNLSGLAEGEHVYNNDYNKFESWQSPIASIDTQHNGGTQVAVNVKDLKGYKGLDAMADIYRMRHDLSYAEREELDYLYYSGDVSDNIKDMFETLSGDDQIVYDVMHRASVRQFQRQIISRVHNKDCDDCSVDKLYSDQRFWMNVSHNRVNQKGGNGNVGYRYTPNSLSFGYDRDLSIPDLKAGVAFSYGTGDVKANSNASVLRYGNNIHEYIASVYGKYGKDNYYINWNIGGGLMENETALLTPTVNTTGKYNSYAGFVNLESGYNFGTEQAKLEPYTGLEYTKLISQSYEEKGVGARQFGRTNRDILEIPIGVRTSYDFTVDRFILTPALDIAYARNIGENATTGTGRFVGNPGTPWRISSGAEGRDSFRGALNLKINHMDLPFAVNIGYGVDRRQDYTDQQFYGTIRWDF